MRYFLLIATYEATQSEEVAKEIDEAKRLGKRIIPCRPNDIDWSDLEKLEIDLTQGPEFRNEYELVRKIDSQLRREFEGTSVRAVRNDTRHYEIGLTSSKYEPPSLQEEYINKKEEEQVNALFNKAYDLDKNGRYKEAIEYYEKVLELDPNYSAAWNNKGSALSNLGRYKEAIECYDKAIEIDENNATAWNNKGIALDNLGKNKDAKKCYNKARELGYKD